MTARVLVLCALAAAGCKKGDGLVVVELSANPPVAGVTALRVTMTIGAQTSGPKSITQLPTSSFGAAPTAAFAIDASADVGSMLGVHVDALDGSGATLASGDGSGTIAAGQRTTVSVLLQGALPMHDMATTDGGGIRPCRFDDDMSTFDNCVFGQ